MKTPTTRLRTGRNLTLEEAFERLDKRFSHVEGNDFMSLVKAWVKEILKEKES